MDARYFQKQPAPNKYPLIKNWTKTYEPHRGPFLKKARTTFTEEVIKHEKKKVGPLTYKVQEKLMKTNPTGNHKW